MAVNDQLVAPSPADDLLARLDEPQVVASLNTVLDHADLLALLVVALDGFIGRGDVIGDSLAKAVGEVRDASAAAEIPPVDYRAVAGSVASLSGSVVEATPALNALLTSRLTDPRAVAVISHLASALVEGHDKIEAEPTGPAGVFGLLRTLKDPDVSRGIGFFIQVAKAFGRSIGPQ